VTAAAVPSADEVLAIVREAVVRVMECRPDAVTRETHLQRDLDADSIALVEIVDLVEERLMPLARPGFRIEDEDLDDIATVGQAVDYIVARLA
jgi:acyl carrier protein